MDAETRFDLSNNTLHLRECGVFLPLERYQPIIRTQRNAPAEMPSDFGRNLSAASAMISTTIIDESAPIPATPPVFSVYPDVDKHGTVDYYRNLIYEHYTDVFVDKLPAQLPPLRVVNHRIPVKIEKPWTTPLYRLPEHHKKVLEVDIEPKLRAGIIVSKQSFRWPLHTWFPRKTPETFAMSKIYDEGTRTWRS